MSSENCRSTIKMTQLSFALHVKMESNNSHVPLPLPLSLLPKTSHAQALGVKKISKLCRRPEAKTHARQSPGKHSPLQSVPSSRQLRHPGGPARSHWAGDWVLWWPTVPFTTLAYILTGLSRKIVYVVPPWRMMRLSLL